MTFSSINPATGETVWQGEAASPEQVITAVAAARTAFATWSRQPMEERISILRRYGTVLEQRKSRLAELISREVGKPTWEALTEVQSMIGKIEISIEAHAKRCIEFRGGKAVTRFRPHGVVGVLGPFNFPGHLPNGHIVPALLAGNTVVYKPSEYAPATAEIVLAAWREAGLPADVLQVVQGLHETGAAVADSPGIDGLFFTGSARTGLLLLEKFARTTERILALEMGGNNPLVVWGVSDPKMAALPIVQSAFLSAGQRCTCARRLILSAGAEGDRVITAVQELMSRIRVGPYTDRPEPFMGPVISVRTAERLLQVQEDFYRRGGVSIIPLHLLKPGTGLMNPGLIDVTHMRDRIDEEHFGPLLQVIRVPDFASALQEANATRYGLAAGLLSDSHGCYDEFLDRVRAGIINWNQPLTGASSAAPFGGIGLSGNHRPSAYFAADYCSYPVASLEQPTLPTSESLPTGIGQPGASA